jgi:hypothetical protein
MASEKNPPAVLTPHNIMSDDIELDYDSDLNKPLRITPRKPRPATATAAVSSPNDEYIPKKVTPRTPDPESTVPNTVKRSARRTPRAVRLTPNTGRLAPVPPKSPHMALAQRAVRERRRSIANSRHSDRNILVALSRRASIPNFLEPITYTNQV